MTMVIIPILDDPLPERREVRVYARLGQVVLSYNDRAVSLDIVIPPSAGRAIAAALAATSDHLDPPAQQAGSGREAPPARLDNPAGGRFLHSTS